MQQEKTAVLLLTKQLHPAPKGGREMLCKLNYDVLTNILGSKLILFELPQPSPIKLQDIYNAFRGDIDGLTTKNTQQALELIQRGNVCQVFVDGSNLGGFVSKIKRRMPDVEVITFFHNIEVRFFWGALKTTKNIRTLAVLIVNYLAERKATRLSDKRICLSLRDSQLLKSIYGKSATHISPIALEDKLTCKRTKQQIGAAEPFALFVGGNFYANREGIAWFVKNVAWRIDIKVYVVGKGMENIRADLEIPGRVEVIGPVENLSDWYSFASFVIAPIFDGSGMKTKVAEALMYGKKVVGTPEAFSGYEDIAESAGWLCKNADEFVAAMKTAQRTIDIAFDPFLRELYEKKYSLSAAATRLAQVLSPRVCDLEKKFLQ
jgi:glycosyltransferase involved in cell wall biosynthesis